MIENFNIPKVRKLKQLGNSSRNTYLLDRRGIETKADKKLSYRKFNKGGRNNTGKITIRARGGGNKIRIRKVSHNYDQGVFIKNLIDPNRSSLISLIEKENGEQIYIPSRQDRNVYKLGNLEVREIINTIETYPYSKGKLVRSAGTFATIKQKEEGSKHVIVQMRSGEIRKFHVNCRCYKGKVPFEDHRLLTYGKAGRKVWNNRRPLSKGQCQNRTDHPNGGENTKHKPKTPKQYKGKLAHGKKYRFNINPLIIKTRRGVFKKSKST